MSVHLSIDSSPAVNIDNFLKPPSDNGYLKDLWYDTTRNQLILIADHHLGDLKDLSVERVIFLISVSSDGKRIGFELQVWDTNKQRFALYTDGGYSVGYPVNLSWAFPKNPPNINFPMDYAKINILCKDDNLIYTLGYSDSAHIDGNTSNYMENIVLPALVNSARVTLAARTTALTAIVGENYNTQQEEINTIEYRVKTVEEDIDHLTNGLKDFSSRFSTI